MSRVRNKSFETVHHLTSRIAHKAFFLKDEERDSFLKLMLRVSSFSGVELLGWCIMNNHFHIYAYLPQPTELCDAEVMRRFALLHGDADRLLADMDEAAERRRTQPDGSEGQTGESADLQKSIRRRMYSIAEFMRMIKQWFSAAYNDRSGHKGTMWEAVYGDNASFLPDDPCGYEDIRDILAYIHLNPIRAAITDRFDGYKWSSYAAFRRGEAEAVSAMRRAYPGLPDEEIVTIHEDRMRRLLEGWKRKRAEEIARKRLAGCEMPTDPITEECMIAQAKERIERAQQSVVALQLERTVHAGAKARRNTVCSQILELVSVYPESTPQSLARALSVPLRTVQRYLAGLMRSGAIVRRRDGLELAQSA